MRGNCELPSTWIQKDMPLYAVPERELRDHCKRTIETLELWLRRLIDDALSASYGANYIDAIKPSGDRVIRNQVGKALKERTAKEPSRFPRVIDAALLDEQIDLICHPELYKSHFKSALGSAFPLGCEEARTFLGRLVKPRNALYHANPVSLLDAHRVLCYSLDVIDALKTYYAKDNLSQQYNVPLIVRVSDSLGHVTNMSGSNRHPQGSAMLDFSLDGASHLRCGDTISIEVEVDPTFNPAEYEIRWIIGNAIRPRLPTVGTKFTLHLTEEYVSTRFCVVCRVTSNKAWHKLGSFDDQIDIAYRVLPPP
jgi:hypothetical protein